MTPAEAKELFIKEMSRKQDQRAEQVGGHTWAEQAAIYGPKILYAEIANINSRLKSLFWDQPALLEGQADRAKDLLIDLGNYTEFLYAWVEEAS